MTKWNLAAVAVLACMIAFGAHAYRRLDCWLPVPFDAAVWRTGEEAGFSADAPRLRMADWLLGTGVLLGKTRHEIEGMLGPVTKTDYFDNYDMVYWLGPERGLIRVDSEWLVFRLDAAGRVSRALIVRD
ncbi:MAG: hypothetical protein AB1921_17220 [Thermodesulfobacteriota bacterium]